MSEQSATGHPALAGDLSHYDAIYWSIFCRSPSAAVITNVTNFVTAGGRLFVTGYDGLSCNSSMWPLVGAGSVSDDISGTTGAITTASNSLTNGAVDIRGLTPTGGYLDLDRINSLNAGTVGVAVANGGGWHWTLRTLGSGEVAYVSNGYWYNSNPDDHPSWENTSAGRRRLQRSDPQLRTGRVAQLLCQGQRQRHVYDPLPRWHRGDIQ